MRDERKAGFALIAGSLGGVVTMAIHPTMATNHFIGLSEVAHTLALFSVLLMFLGSCGLARALSAPDRLAFVALVTFGFAAVAVMFAGAVSGFVIPGIVRMMERDVPEAAAQWRIAMASIFQINQAMSRIYSVGAAGAIVLWSVCCLRQGRLSKAVALFGCISSPVIVLLILAGHLRLNVHGMAVVMLSEVVWFVGMGAGLMREEKG